MGVVGSLPSPPPPPSPLISVDNIKTFDEESTPSNDECSYSVVTVHETDSNMTNCTLNSNIDDQKKSDTNGPSKSQGIVAVAYGPITVRVRRFQPPTLATGRRSKFLQLEGDAAIKRELRRKKNRDAAKKLKEKRFIIEQQLEKDIQDLESKEQELESRVKDLEAYKEQLESRCKNIVFMQEKLAITAASTLKNIERNRRQLVNQSVPIYQNDTNDIKEEPRSPSPQWQLLFSI
jgi:hypothetical protein